MAEKDQGLSPELRRKTLEFAVSHIFDEGWKTYEPLELIDRLEMLWSFARFAHNGRCFEEADAIVMEVYNKRKQETQDREKRFPPPGIKEFKHLNKQ